MSIYQGSANQMSNSKLEKSISYTINTSRIDNEIAYDIHDFLNGYINKLPSLSKLNNVINNLNGSVIISQACGVIIYLNERIDKPNNILIIFEKVIDNTKARYDRISDEEHFVGLISNTPKRETLKDINLFSEENKKLINFPEINEKRVTFIQNYLKDYLKKYGEKDFETPTNKMIKKTKKK